jgi:hypothetical protein
MLRGIRLDSPGVWPHRGAMRCFSCNAPIELRAGERIGFADRCERCGSDLRVCLNCRFHDPSAYNECREPGSEPVRERDRANRCDYFSPGDREAGGPASARDGARSALEGLFKKS